MVSHKHKLRDKMQWRRIEGLLIRVTESGTIMVYIIIIKHALVIILTDKSSLTMTQSK